ncbi:MAG: SRPBCC domain-containing protein [Thermoplasmata archaeon]
MAARKKRTIRVPVFIHASPKKVFKAITKPKLLTRWFMDSATLSARKGGTYSFAWEGGPTHTGKVLEFVRGKRLAITWQWPGQESLGMTKLKLSVEPKEGGTILRFTHTGFQTEGAWDELYDGAIRGWTYFMMNLKSVLENGHDLRSPYDW